MMDHPSAYGSNGRDGRGRFTTGNPGGPGNPHAARVGEWRSVLVETVTPADLRAVIRMLLEKAKAGERWAVCELLDRTLGRSAPMLDEPASGALGLSVDLERLKEVTAMSPEEREALAREVNERVRKEMDGSDG